MIAADLCQTLACFSAWSRDVVDYIELLLAVSACSHCRSKSGHGGLASRFQTCSHSPYAREKVAQLIIERCRKRNISVSELKGGSRRGTIPQVRAEIVNCLVDRYGLPLAEVARHVGVSTSAVSKTLTRAKQ